MWLWHFSSQTAITRAEGLLPRKWLHNCVLMGSRELIHSSFCFACTHSFCFPHQAAIVSLKSSHLPFVFFPFHGRRMLSEQLSRRVVGGHSSQEPTGMSKLTSPGHSKKRKREKNHVKQQKQNKTKSASLRTNLPLQRQRLWSLPDMSQVKPQLPGPAGEHCGLWAGTLFIYLFLIPSAETNRSVGIVIWGRLSPFWLPLSLQSRGNCQNSGGCCPGSPDTGPVCVLTSSLSFEGHQSSLNSAHLYLGQFGIH